MTVRYGFFPFEQCFLFFIQCLLACAQFCFPLSKLCFSCRILFLAGTNQRKTDERRKYKHPFHIQEQSFMSSRLFVSLWQHIASKRRSGSQAEWRGIAARGSCTIDL